MVKAPLTVAFGLSWKFSSELPVCQGEKGTWMFPELSLWSVASVPLEAAGAVMPETAESCGVTALREEGWEGQRVQSKGNLGL